MTASNNGRPRPPAWWLNLKANPHALVQVKREKNSVLDGIEDRPVLEEMAPRIESRVARGRSGGGAVVSVFCPCRSWTRDAWRICRYAYLGYASPSSTLGPGRGVIPIGVKIRQPDGPGRIWWLAVVGSVSEPP